MWLAENSSTHFLWECEENTQNELKTILSVDYKVNTVSKSSWLLSSSLFSVFKLYHYYYILIIDVYKLDLHLIICLSF